MARVGRGVFGAGSVFVWSTVHREEFLFFTGFWLILAECSFWRGDWALGIHSMGFRRFPDSS